MSYFKTSLTPIERYLRHLDDGEFEAAARVFVDDAVYVRPRFEPGVDGGPPRFGELVAVRGRAAILESFRRRGRQPYRHRVVAAATEGGRCFVEMTLAGYGADIESLAVADLRGKLITRYVAVVAPAAADVAALILPPGAGPLT